jgi:HsdM N-terminal domain
VAVVGKEAERAELHKRIWRIANDLRGSVDGWDFKAHVLGTLFYRFISENLAAYLNQQERKAGTPDFDYAALGDVEAERGRRETVAEKGFYILPSELFANVRELARHDENLNERLANVFRDIEGSARPSARPPRLGGGEQAARGAGAAAARVDLHARMPPHVRLVDARRRAELRGGRRLRRPLLGLHD